MLNIKKLDEDSQNDKINLYKSIINQYYKKEKEKYTIEKETKKISINMPKLNKINIENEIKEEDYENKSS